MSILVMYIVDVLCSLMLSLIMVMYDFMYLTLIAVLCLDRIIFL